MKLMLSQIQISNSIVLKGYIWRMDGGSFLLTWNGFQMKIKLLLRGMEVPAGFKKLEI